MSANLDGNYRTPVHWEWLIALDASSRLSPYRSVCRGPTKDTIKI
ncbi:MAG: hypothetical protein ACK5Q3_18495 [Planctomycetota bacterium]